jgi:hypothetical protein
MRVAALGASVGVTLHSAVDEAGTMSVGVEESEQRIFRFKLGGFDCWRSTTEPSSTPRINTSTTPTRTS